MSQYIGVADCHGLESFVPVAEKALEAELDGENGQFAVSLLASRFAVRAQANRHRHAVVYRAEVSEADAKKIKRLLYGKGKYADALIKLKQCAKEIEVGKYPGMAKSWRMIPNPELDPYRG